MTNEPESLSRSPSDLDAIGTRFNIPPYRMEELVALRRRGATDAEILASLRTPSDDGPAPATPIPLTDAQGKQLLNDLARLPT
jgi:hypothetical protein